MVTWISLLGFATLMVGTPGPANFVLMAAGARWGVRPLFPFILGVIVGKAVLNAAIFLGLLALLNHHPYIADTIKWVSALYLLWLAWKVAGLHFAETPRSAPPPGFTAGLMIHPLNPKAWAMISTAYIQFSHPLLTLALQWVVVTGTFVLVQLVFHTLWCWGGAYLVERLRGSVWERVLMLSLSAMTIGLIGWLFAKDLVPA